MFYSAPSLSSVDHMLNRLARYLCLIVAALLLGACTSDDSIKAHVRLLNASPDYTSLDLYADDELQISAVAYENASGYAKLGEDTYTIKLKSNGVSSTLETLDNESLARESHQAYVGYGTSGHFATLKIDEDQNTPDENDTSVSVLNTANAGSLDLYLTDASVNLADASPIFSSVANGTAASYQTIDSGTYRVRVTAAGDKDDVRFDQSGVSFGSKQILNLILSATQGGTLVNVLWLPQQGSLSKLANNGARVRGAVGMPTGSAVTAIIGGVNLLTNATMGVISTSYQPVTAGTAAVSLSVNGSPVSVADQTLVGGGDYTLLVWQSSGATQATLISDDNRLPSDDSKAKIRLMNGMSALGANTTLSVDYSPVAENVALGQASAYAEVDEGTDYVIDVVNASTSASVYSRTSVSLTAEGVYTMFIAGDGSSSGTAGTLRKDR